jgi:hypothetical protein
VLAGVVVRAEDGFPAESAGMSVMFVQYTEHDVDLVYTRCPALSR